MPKSANERKALERERKRAQGLKRGDVWARPEDWSKIRQLEKTLKAKTP